MKTEFILKLLAIGVVSAGLAYLAFFVPLTQTEQWIFRETGATPGTLTMQPGGRLTQTFRSSTHVISRLTVFVTNGRIQSGDIQVRILNQEGHELARELAVYQSYALEKLQLTFPFKGVATNATEQYRVEITVSGREPLTFVTVSSPRYQRELLETNTGAIPDHDLLMSSSYPTRLSHGAQQGILAAIFFMLGLYVIQLLPNQNSRLPWIAAMVLLVIVTPLALGGFWYSEEPLGINDWDYYFSLHHVWHQTITEHGQFPFWNPYTCGGTAGLGDPEFPVFMPTFWLELLFGVPNGVRLAIYLSVVVGSIGMLQLGKRLGLSVTAALVTALIGYFGSVNLLEIVEGHVNVFASMWIPWIFWAWLGAYRGTSRPLWCGLFLAFIFLQGGIYLLMYTLIAFVILLLLVPSPRRALLTTFYAGLWALGLASIKLIPVLLWLREFPDKAYASSNYTLPYIIDILFGRHLHGSLILFEQTAGWHEYGAYIGYFAFGLAILGLSQLGRSRVVRGLAIAAVLSLLLSSAGPALQPFFDITPWLPRSMISRVILFSIIPLALLAGVGIDVLRRHRVPGRLVAFTCIALLAADLLSFSYQLSQQSFIIPEAVPAHSPAPSPIAFTGKTFEATGTNGEKYSRAYPVVQAGYGTLNYCSVLGPQANIRTIEDEGAADIVTVVENKGTAQLTYWSPNAITATATLTEPGSVVVNTNYAKGWFVNGQPARELAGRVAVDLPAGTHDLVFRYRTPGFLAGAFITIATLIALGLSMWQRKKKTYAEKSLA